MCRIPPFYRGSWSLLSCNLASELEVSKSDIIDSSSEGVGEGLVAAFDVDGMELLIAAAASISLVNRALGFEPVKTLKVQEVDINGEVGGLDVQVVVGLLVAKSVVRAEAD